VPSPAKITNYVDRDKDRLTSKYQKPKLRALVGALSTRKQEAENAFWLLLSRMNLETATGDLLTKIGKMVGEARLGRNDDDLRVAVRLRIRVNRSNGRAVDLIAIARLAAVNGTTPHYAESYPAGWSIEIANLPGPNAVAKLLGEAKAAGTSGHLVYTPDDDTYCVWGYDGDAVHASAELWSYVPNSDPPNAWAASVAVPSP